MHLKILIGCELVTLDAYKMVWVNSQKGKPILGGEIAK